MGVLKYSVLDNIKQFKFRFVRIFVVHTSSKWRVHEIGMILFNVAFQRDFAERSGAKFPIENALL